MANRFGLGQAQFNLVVSNDQALQAFAQTEAAAIRSSKKIAAAIDTINNLPARSAASALAVMKKANDDADKAAAASAKAAAAQSAAMRSMASSAVGAVGAVAGVSVALGTLNTALVDTAEKTYAAQQAQFQFNEVYKSSAGIFREFTNGLANDTKILNTDLEKGMAILGGLQKNYGFTSDQIQRLTKLAVDAAAVHGIPLIDAFKSVEAAMRGEGEAAEKLGFTLNRDFVKNNANMTAGQRQLFFSLTDVTRAQITYHEALRQGAKNEGAAIRRTHEAIGAFDKLTVAITKFQIAMGTLVTPGMEKFANNMSTIVEAGTHLVSIMADLEKRTGVPAWVATAAAVLGLALPGGIAALAVGAGGLVGIDALRRAQTDARRQQGNSLDPNPESGAIPEGQAVAAQDDAIRRRIQKENELKDALRIVLDKREKDIAESTKRNIKVIEAEMEAERDRYEELRAQTQAEKHDRQEAAQARRDAAMEVIEAEAEASKVAFDNAIELLRLERDEKLAAADAAHDGKKKALERESEAVHAAAEAQIQEQENLRDARLEAAEETRNSLIEISNQEKEAALDDIRAQIAAAQNLKDAEIEAAEETKKALLEKLDEQENARNKSIEKSIARAKNRKDDAINNAEAERDAELKRLEDEGRARDRARELEDRALDDAQEAELRAIDDRNNAIKESLADERDALEDVARARLRTLQDQAEEAEEQHRATIARIDEERDANDKAHDDEMRSIKEQGDARLKELDDRISATDALEKAFRNEQTNSELQDKLIVAQRKGDPDEIARIQKEINDELVRQQFEAQRESLKNTRDAVEDEIDAQEKAAKEAYELRKEYLDKQKKDEQDAYKSRKDLIDKEERDVREGLQDALEAIEDRTKAFETSVSKEKQLINDRYLALKRALDDQRYAEDEAFRIRKEAVQTAFDNERRRLEELYDDPEKGIFAKLAKQSQKTKDEFDKRRKTVNDAYDEERKRIEENYDDPENGVFAKLRAQQTATERAFDERNKTINAAYKAEQDAIKATYDDDATGSIPAIKRAVKAAEIEMELRGEAIDAAYKDEQAAIKLTYDHPIDGLIAKQEAARKAAEAEYELRRKAVVQSYKDEQTAIYETYDHPVTGLFVKQKKAHDDQMTNLENQKTAWEDWKNKVTGAIGDAQRDLNTFINKIKEMEAQGILVPGSVADEIAKNDDDDDNDRGRGGGSGSSGVVRTTNPGSGEPYNVAFGFNQLYDPPIPGLPARHRGVDLTLPGPDNGRGKPVGAFSDALVIARTDEEDNGMGLITQREADGLYEFYGHFDSRNVTSGDRVKRGDKLGVLGASGTEGFPHLHYEVRRNAGGDAPGSTIDPTPFMQGMQNPIDGGGGNSEPKDDEYDGEFVILRPFGPRGPAIVLAVKATDWYAKAKQYAKKFNFSEPTTFARQMELESDGFAEDVIKGERKSSAGAIGIAQFMPDTAEALGVDPYDPIDSLKGAAKYMHYLEERYDGVRNALWAYNAGEGNLQDGYMPEETEEYLKRLRKFRNGTMVEEPTLMIGLNSGEAGIAGETGQPERLLGVNATQAYDNGDGGPQQLIRMPITIGNNVIEDIWIQGIKLTVKSGRSIGLPGIKIQ